MANVKIRVTSVSAEELDAVKEGQEIGGGKVPTEKLAVASIFAHQALSLGKQILSTSINNISNFTGDSVKQDRIQHIAGIAGDIATIGTGFAVGNVVGAIVATVGVAAKGIINAVTTNRQEMHADRSVELLRQRSGNSTTNGSRTEN